MNKFFEWMEKHFVPVAAKIGSNRYLISIRDAFIAMMPLTIAFAVAVLLNQFVGGIPAMFGITIPAESVAWFTGINGSVWNGTAGIFALILVVSFAYQLAKNFETDEIASVLVSLAAYVILAGGPWGSFSSYTGVSATFTALIFTTGAVFLFKALSLPALQIKMPESVPPAIGKTFKALIPAVLVCYVFAIFTNVFAALFEADVQTIIYSFVQEPAMGLLDSFGAVIGITLLVQLLWFFGLHGTAILSPIVDGAYTTMGVANSEAFLAGQEAVYSWTKSSFDAFVWMGGAGCTVALVIAILIFSKKKEERIVAGIGAPMGIFNINEPVTFGIPLVLNPTYFFPYILICPILATIAFLATAIGLVPAAVVTIPWICPPIIGGFLATASWKGAVLSAINLAIAVVIWSIFVIAGNKTADVEES